MLSSLRNPEGGPALRVRIIALVLVAGLVLLSAPVVLVPVLRWLISLL
jgi:hypothetical protein